MDNDDVFPLKDLHPDEVDASLRQAAALVSKPTRCAPLCAKGLRNPSTTRFLPGLSPSPQAAPLLLLDVVRRASLHRCLCSHSSRRSNVGASVASPQPCFAASASTSLRTSVPHSSPLSQPHRRRRRRAPRVELHPLGNGDCTGTGSSDSESSSDAGVPLLDLGRRRLYLPPDDVLDRAEARMVTHPSASHCEEHRGAGCGLNHATAQNEPHKLAHQAAFHQHSIGNPLSY